MVSSNGLDTRSSLLALGPFQATRQVETGSEVITKLLSTSEGCGCPRVKVEGPTLQVSLLMDSLPSVEVPKSSSRWCRHSTRHREDSSMPDESSTSTVLEHPAALPGALFQSPLSPVALVTRGGLPTTRLWMSAGVR